MEIGTNTCYKLLLSTYIICSTFFAISLFLTAFFPFSHPANTTSTLDDIPGDINGIKLDKKNLYKPSVEKIVFMVIDALRWDFVKDAHKSNSMPVTTASLTNDSACLIQARASTPTVTMPRIKSMMTGALPGFIDVVLNLGATSVTGDSLLNQAKKFGHNLIFYGDDTWLKLFPTTFHRHEGTTSFFVSDFTEVDDNVTRHIDTELMNDDWSIMILHYLGLDHIGHTLGPQSPLVPPKLQEMDRIIGKILGKIQEWNSLGTPALLVVSGDHGMKNSGGHGGATSEETLVPFLVFGNSCPGSFSQIEQIDIATTLSMILGVPIPQANLGSIAMDIIKDLPDDNKLFLLHYNAKHLFGHFRRLSEFESSEIYDDYYRTIKLHAEWLIGKRRKVRDFQVVMDLYDKVLKGMKEFLIKSSVRYDRTVMTIAIIMIFQVLAVVMRTKWREFEAKTACYWWVSGVCLWLLSNHFLYNESNEAYFELRTASIMVLVFTFYTVNCCLCPNIEIGSFHSAELSKLICPILVVLHALSFASSSFVEEEHQTWYFFWPTFLLYLLFVEFGSIYERNVKSFAGHLSWSALNDRKILKVLFLMIQHRILRKLNSTGNKYAHLPDIGGWMKGQESCLAMSLTVIISLGLLIFIGLICEEPRQRRVTLGFHLALAVCVYLRHAAERSVGNFLLVTGSKGVYEVRTFWVVLAGFLVYSIRRMIANERRQFLQRLVFTLVQVWVSLVTLLHRAHNVPLVPMELITILVVFDLVKNYRVQGLVGVSYAIGNVFYFYQGNSNSLATVDVAAGYVGLQSYWPILGMIYVGVSTYAAPVLAYLLLVYKFTCEKQGRNVVRANQGYAVLRVFPVCVYGIIVTLQRYHLFIWTVFSPKLLYETVHTAVVFLVGFVVQVIFLVRGKYAFLGNC